jgi:outer membrane receptor protein involved in Fe transport
LFPAIAVTWKKNNDNQFGLSYSKRIDRPIYQNLNPFEYKLDEYTSRKGNTNLQPQYTNSIGISYTYKSKLTAILNYSSIRSMFAQLFDTAERTKSFITITNIGKQDLVSLNLNYIIQAKHFSGFFNLNSFYAHSSADFGKDRTIDLSSVSLTVRSQQSWQFSKTYTAELVEYYSSPAIWEGTFKIGSLGSVDAGLQKTILEGRATLKASVTDIFYTMQARLSNSFAGQNQTLWRGWEPHLFRINATYRFRSNQVKAGRLRKTGLEEESKRVQSGS